MHKSHSVARQGTFDTGQARPDKRGSIRRGDIELPIVDETRIRQKRNHNPHDDSGFYNQIPSETLDAEESPRFVDHNKLFAAEDADRRPAAQERAVKGSLGDGASRTEKRREEGKRPSIPRTSHVDDEHHPQARSKGAVPSKDGAAQHGRRPSGDTVNNSQNEQKRDGLNGSSRIPHPQKQEKLYDVNPATSLAQNQPPDSLEYSEGRNHKSQHGRENVVDARLTSKGEHTTSKSLNHPRQKKPLNNRQNSHQQLQRRLSTTAEEGTIPIKAHAETTANDYTTSSVTSPNVLSADDTKQQQQAPTITVQPDSDSNSTSNLTSPTQKEHVLHQQAQPSTNKQNPEELRKSQPVVSASNQETFYQAFPHSQLNPYLLSTQESSTPPQDHTRKVTNPSAKKLDTGRDQGTTDKEHFSVEKSLDSGGVSGSEGSKFQDQASNMSTAAEGPRRAGGESLSQVTTERDQLLKNEKTYKQRILQLEEEVKSVVKQSQELSSENRLLQNKLEAYETKVYGGSLEMKELRREKQELMTTVATVTGEKQQMQTENERLKGKLSEADSKSKQWDAIYMENNKLKTKQAELEKRILDMENEKIKLRNSVATAESSQLDKLNAVQNENKKLQADLINLQTKNNSLDRKMERLQTENKELADRLDQKKSEIDELMRAMTTQTNVEVELKEANQELEFAKNKIEDYKKDLQESNHRYEVLEKEKDAAKNSLRLKESECKGLKANTEEKDTQIGELKRQVDTAKRNVKRLEDDLEDTKQVEKDSVNMKARIRSLKNEIEDSLAANHKMKQDRTEARLEADRLNRELATTSEALSEARRYIKKLESDRAGKDTLEEEMKLRKQREQALESQVRDLNARNEQLKTVVQNLEEDKEVMEKNRPGVAEVEAANRKLQEENKKLRQMLVERNMEIAQRQSERTALVNRVDNLERKQNDSDIKVQQLKGWVDNVYTYTTVPSTTHQTAPEIYQQSQPVITLPPVASKAQQRPSKAAGGDRIRRKKGQHLPQQQRQNQLNRSWEDLNRLKVEQEESIRTTPGLPGVMDSTKIINLSGPSQPGYFDMYKSKMKLIRERKW